MILRILPFWPILAVLAGLYGRESAWWAIGLYHAGILTAWWAERRRDLGAELRRGFDRWTALLGAGAGISGFVVVTTLLPLLTGQGEATWINLARRLDHFGLEGAGLLAFTVYFITVHPLLEEVGWRGLLGTRSPRLHWHDATFATYHLFVLWLVFPGAWLLYGVSFLVLTGAAWFWRQIRRRQDGLGGPVLVHMAADLGIMLAVLNQIM